MWSDRKTIRIFTWCSSSWKPICIRYCNSRYVFRWSAPTFSTHCTNNTSSTSYLNALSTFIQGIWSIVIWSHRTCSLIRSARWKWLISVWLVVWPTRRMMTVSHIHPYWSQSNHDRVRRYSLVPCPWNSLRITEILESRGHVECRLHPGRDDRRQSHLCRLIVECISIRCFFLESNRESDWTYRSTKTWWCGSNLCPSREPNLGQLLPSE